jgi:hypothetical protein
MASEGFIEFGFGENDDRVGGQKFDRFKGKEGENYRVSFVWWPTKADGTTPDLDAKTPRFTGAKRLYIAGVGYVLDKGPEYGQFGQSKLNVVTIIAVWPTNRKGELDRARFASGDVEVKPWIFAKDKYEQLKRRHDEFPFGSYDLAIACTDSQYQKMDLSPCRESLFRKVVESDKMKGMSDSIVAQVNTIAANIQDILARDVSIEKIREKLGGAPVGGGSAGGGSAGGGANTAAIDDLLDDV